MDIALISAVYLLLIAIRCLKVNLNNICTDMNGLWIQYKHNFYNLFAIHDKQ